MSNQTSGLQKLVQELLEVSKTLILLGDGADYHRTVCKSLTEIAKFWQERFLASDPAGKSDKVIASYINVLREVTEYVKEVRKPGSFSQTALVNLKRAAKSNNFLQYHRDLGEKMKNAVIPLIDSDKVMSENFSNTNSHHKDFDTLILMMFLSKGAKIQDSGEYEINLNPSKFEDSITEVPKERDWIKYVIEISKANDHFNVPVEKGIKQKVFEELKKKKKKEFFTSSDSHFDGEKTLFTKKPMNMQNNIINTSITLSHKDKDKATEFNIRIIKLHDPKDNIEVQKRIYQGKIVTVRKINNVDQNNYQSFQRYSRIINLLSRNNHIEKYYGTLKSSNGLYVVSEWVANDNLHKYLKNEKNISWVIKLKLAEGISSGLTFCHEAEILYNDLSSENILLDDNINPKLSNFGLSRITNPGRISLAGQPTGIRYAAPELILEYQIPYSKAMDVYSFGILMAEIASQQTPPFADSSTDDKVNDKISQEKRPTVPADLNSDYKLLMESCWHQNPRVRPSIEIVRSELQVLLNTSSTQNKPHDLSVITTHGVHKLLDEEFHHVFSTAPSPSLSVIGSMDDEDENSYPKALYLFDSKHHIHEHDNNVLDWKEVMRLHNKKLYAEAYPHLEEYAKREGPNSIQAKYLIGWYLLDGREGVIQDERDAMKYLRQVSDDSPTLYKAAAQYLFARGCLKGSMYDKGTGLAYLEMAVKARDKHALFWYADILLNGEHDLPVDIKRAEELFKEAKSRGHPDAEDALEKLKSS